MLDKKYDHKIVEENKYDFWKDNGFFEAGKDKSKVPFCVVIPPPNVTGKLHLGHAWDTTLQDIMVRYKRMDGYDALWLPGMDHAGIATQAKVDKKLKEQGIKPREMDREEWLKVAWDWKKEYAENIHRQWKTLGLSLDYSRERFTLDEGLSKAVRQVFVDLYNQGLIYRGERIINWDPVQMTALSNEEVIYKDDEGAFYHLKYYLEDKSMYLDVATTRPETLFGDTAVAVNPDDTRYKDLIGKKVILPIVGKLIPIVGDMHADPEFGTGVVKITPAHDPNDYEVGKRHNFKPIWVIDEEGKMKACAEVPPDYQGLDRYEARKKVVDMLSYNNFLLRVKDHEHNVGKCQRCNTTIEPLLSEQWFVKMEPLAKEAIAAVKDGRITFIPERWEKNYLGWMENIRDWCISRQLWWGHQIPAYYHKETGEMVVAKENPDPENYVQDTDCLDTWFSSGLWPFSTMGFPNSETDDFKKFYPTSVLVTGFDIIFFWVARMITMGLEFTGKAPFSKVYIHGLIRDEKGQKMSKSKGNTIDPVQIIDKYGCDALRFTMTSLCTYGGQDIKVSDERFEYGRNFANKLWNASRFVLMNLDGVDNKPIDREKLTLVDKWILNQLNETAKTVNQYMKEYRIGEIAHELYDFFRSEYCDWYVEIAKIQLQDADLKRNTQRVLRYVLDMSLRMLHPIMPHITENVWGLIPGEKETSALIIAKYPVYEEAMSFPKEAEEMKLVFETITSLRNVRQSFNIPTSATVDVEIRAEGKEKEIFTEIEAYIRRLAKVNNITYAEMNAQTPPKSAAAVVSASKLVVPLADLIDLDAEIKRQEKKLEKLTNEKNSLEGRMKNEKFVANAPKELVEQTNARIAEISAQQVVIKDLIDSLR